MPRAKYDYMVMGKTNKNIKNILKKELKADDTKNFDTLTNEHRKIINQLKHILEKLTVIEQKSVTHQTS